jgi:hypothetical protein
MIMANSTFMTAKTHFYHCKPITPTLLGIIGDNTQQDFKKYLF